jgi:hypothetical protein
MPLGSSVDIKQLPNYAASYSSKHKFSSSPPPESQIWHDFINVANFLHAKEIINSCCLDSLQTCGQVDFINYKEKSFKEHLLDHSMGHLQVTR